MEHCTTCEDRHEVMSDGPALGPMGQGWDGKPFRVDCPDCCVPCSVCGVHEWHGLEDGVRHLRDGDGGYWCCVGCFDAWLKQQPICVPSGDLLHAFTVCAEFIEGKTEDCCAVNREARGSALAVLISQLLEEATAL